MSIFAETVSFAVNGKKQGKEMVEFTGTVTSIIFNDYRSKLIYMPVTKVILSCEQEGVILSSENGEICSKIKKSLLAGILDKLGDDLLESRRSTPFLDDCKKALFLKEATENELPYS